MITRKLPNSNAVCIIIARVGVCIHFSQIKRITVASYHVKAYYDLAVEICKSFTLTRATL